MRIKTRFNREDNIFFLLDNEVKRERVEGILIQVDEAGRITILYAIPIPAAEEEHTWIPEAKAFSTLIKLLDSLKEAFDGPGLGEQEKQEVTDDLTGLDEVTFN